MSIKNIVKRDGAIRPYEREKITEAIQQALQAVDSGGRDDAESVALTVEDELEDRYSHVDTTERTDEETDPKSVFPEVEEIQDIVEESLMAAGFHRAAKAGY